MFTFYVVRYFYDVSSFSLNVILNTARQRRPQHIMMETQHVTIKPRHTMTKPHHIMTKPRHIVMLSQYTMTKLQNIKTKFQEQTNKDYITKLWLCIHYLLQSCQRRIDVSGPQNRSVDIRGSRHVSLDRLRLTFQLS